MNTPTSDMTEQEADTLLKTFPHANEYMCLTIGHRITKGLDGNPAEAFERGLEILRKMNEMHAHAVRRKLEIHRQFYAHQDWPSRKEAEIIAEAYSLQKMIWDVAKARDKAVEDQRRTEKEHAVHQD